MTHELPAPAKEDSLHRRNWLAVLTLFGGYCLGRNLMVGLHEFGHALGGWIGGGRIIAMVVSPFALSWTSGGPFPRPQGHLLFMAGGTVFGTLMALLLVWAARGFQRGSLGWIITYLTGTIGVLENGRYLFAGSVVPFGDVYVLLELGVPRWLPALVGLPLLLTFLYLWASFLQGIGLKREDSYRRWVLTTVMGLLPYFLLCLGYHLWRIVQEDPAFFRSWLHSPHKFEDLHGKLGDHPANFWAWLFSLSCSPVVVLLMTTGAYLVGRKLGRRSGPPTLPPRWARAWVLLVLGLVLIGTELLVFSKSM